MPEAEVTNKYKDVSFGDAEAVFNILGGVEGIARLKKGDLVVVERKTQIIPRRISLAKLTVLASPEGTVSTEDIKKCLEPKWTVDENGVIYLTLPATTGRTGEEWITHFEQKGDRPTSYAKSVLRSKKFKPSIGVVNKIAILPAKLWKDSDRLTKQIRRDAHAGTFSKGQKLSDPQAEVACLIRDYLTDEEIEALGLRYIVDMHEPIEDSDGDPRLLSADRCGGGRGLSTYFDNPDCQWNDSSGFAFLVSQVIVPQT
ncbi:MAG: hypothetical protein WCW56_01895 [Candidatus Paceibacterota bacterium]|jgi:hypothetical protein